jgi:3-phosphoshikimate 1-carboxyvinyltransferase
MKWSVRRSDLAGTISIPPSKSHTIRALLIATLARGKSVIRKPLLSGDGQSALCAAKSLGAEVRLIEDGIEITGIGSDYDKGDEFLDLGNSGTGTNLFASAAALGTRKRRFDGDSSLRSRPFKPVLEALSQLGATYNLEQSSSDLPFTIQGPLTGGKTRINGVSSQFLSSILLTSPLIRNGSTFCYVYNLHEIPYVQLTMWWLNRQGIALKYKPDFTEFEIPGDQCYKPFDIVIPADFSSATFAAVGAAVTGKGVNLTGLDFSDTQGDKGVFDILRTMGAGVAINENGVTVTPGNPLKGQVIDLNSMPDALPALSVMACATQGETRFVNVAQARIKETDRIAVMCEELLKMGADIEELPDGLIVRQSRLKGAVVNGHDDHRVVMALAIAGMMADGETVIETAQAASVTYPGFVNDFRNIGADITIIN